MKSDPERREFFLEALHTLALFAMAVAQPLYDILGRYPEFLAVRDLPRVEVLLLVVFLSLVAPGLLILVQWAVRLWSPFAYRMLHRLTLVLLAGAFLLQAFKVLPLGGPILSGLALASAASLVWAYTASRPLRFFFHFLTPAVILFPILFLFFTPVRELLKGEEPRERWEVRASPPIVMVVFDEFPSISLMNPEREIDEVLFPNFTRLARETHWFRNATTVSEGTLISVPSILTGALPDFDPPRLPTLSHHPRNLFTLLEKTYDLHVHENLTRLAPPSAGRVRADFPDRHVSLVSDLWLVYLHLLLPSDLAQGLPRVTESWTDFRGQWREADVSEALQARAAPGEPLLTWGDFRADWSLRAERFREFADSIRPSQRPFLYFFHSLLPHAGWEHLPDGRRYRFYEPPGVRGVLGANDRGEDVNRWLEDEWLVAQAYQAHLLQLQFVDRLVGELVDTLKERGLYDRSLLVLTADHGCGFQPGESRRSVGPSNYPEIMSVPLFVKGPFQREGVVHDSNVETIDILPTMLDLMGVEPPWPMDGRSALDRASVERPLKVIYSDRGERFEFEASLFSQEDFVRRKTDLFGHGRPERLFSIGPDAEWIGRPLSTLPVVDLPPGRLEIELDGQRFYESVRSRAPFVPASVTGRVLSPEPGATPRRLAVAVNGTVRAVTRTSVAWGRNRQFAAIVPPDSFQEGPNQVEILLISGSGDRAELWSSAQEGKTFRLERVSDGAEYLLDGGGHRIPILPDEVAGWTAAGFSPSGDRAYVGGWVVDGRSSRPVRSVLVLLNGRSIASGRTHLPRPEAVEMFGDPNLLSSGFYFEFPPAALHPPERAGVRVFALSDRGVAGELNYPSDASDWPFLPPP